MMEKGAHLEGRFHPAEVPLGSIQADFFLPSIALDFMHICHALDDGFLNPFVHLVFILIESVTAKDVAAGKRWRGCCPLMVSLSTINCPFALAPAGV